MGKIVLATLNARYPHSAFGLRCLLANMGDLEGDTCLLEFVINDSPIDILATILAQQPEIVGLGVYIWNVEPLTRLVADMKQVRPDITIILGGPEVSYETHEQPIVDLADYVITGEADLAFPELCRMLLRNEPAPQKVIPAATPQLTLLQLPYRLYSDEDIRNRVIYVEVSRGCPFTCEFCLSALEIPVRLVDVRLFLGELQLLLDRGARQFKFVDRTFNLNLRVSQQILTFFLDRWQPGLFLHFEMIPDRLPDPLRHLLARFPAGAVQLEIGVQTFSQRAGELISRPQNNQLLEDNFRYLRQSTGVHLHADLIVGLPGESWAEFAAGFDRLYRLQPQEIQVGMLKRLRGTPIVRHDEEWQMIYSPHPPYEILKNRLLTFEQIQQLRRFSRFWDLIGNSGNFAATMNLLVREQDSPFDCLFRLSKWLYQQEQRQHGISLTRLFKRVYEYLSTLGYWEESQIVETLHADYIRHGRRDCPSFLRAAEGLLPPAQPQKTKTRSVPGRQHRHQADSQRTDARPMHPSKPEKSM